MRNFQMVAERVHSQTPKSQFEFRIWPQSWPVAASQVQKSWRLVGAERRCDIYLRTSHSPDCLVKLRAGLWLETERRGHDCGLLQFWTNQPYPVFPMSRLTLRALAEDLAVDPLPPEVGLSSAHLITGLGASAPSVLPVTVRKSRLLFRTGNSRAELCHVAVFGQTRLSLAIEASDPATVFRTIDSLGIGDLPNRSYGDMLCHGAFDNRPPMARLTRPTHNGHKSQYSRF